MRGPRKLILIAGDGIHVYINGVLKIGLKNITFNHDDSESRLRFDTPGGVTLAFLFLLLLLLGTGSNFLIFWCEVM